jgi:hypothetical protein
MEASAADRFHCIAVFIPSRSSLLYNAFGNISCFLAISAPVGVQSSLDLRCIAAIAIQIRIFSVNREDASQHLFVRPISLALERLEVRVKHMRR